MDLKFEYVVSVMLKRRKRRRMLNLNLNSFWSIKLGLQSFFKVGWKFLVDWIYQLVYLLRTAIESYRCFDLCLNVIHSFVIKRFHGCHHLHIVYFCHLCFFDYVTNCGLHLECLIEGFEQKLPFGWIRCLTYLTPYRASLHELFALRYTATSFSDSDNFGA